MEREILDRSVTIRLAVADGFSQPLNSYNRGIQQATQNTQQASGMMRGLGTAVAGLGIALGARAVIGIAEDMYELGTASRRANEVFTQLTGGAAQADAQLRSLQGATGGIVDNMTLMSGANRLMMMGLAETSGEVNRLTELAVKLGAAMGNDAGESIENFSLLLANQSLLRLDSFGISSAAVREEMERLLATGQALDREEAFRLAVMSEGADSLERLGDAAAAAETPIARLQTRLDNLWQSISLGVATTVDSAVMAVEQLDQLNAIAGEREAFVNQVMYSRYGSVLHGSWEERSRMFEFFDERQRENFMLGGVNDAVLGLPQFTLGEGMQRLQSQRDIQLNRDMFQSYYSELMGLGGGFGSGGRGLLGNQTLFTDEDVRRANELLVFIGQVDQIADQLGDAEFITDEHLQNAREWQQYVIDGAEALNNITLDQTLFGGTDRNELFGDIQSQLFGMIDTSGWKPGTMNAFSLAGGTATPLSLFLEQMNAQAATQFANDPGGLMGYITGQEGFLRAMMSGGFTDSQALAALTGGGGFMRGGQTDSRGTAGAAFSGTFGGGGMLDFEAATARLSGNLEDAGSNMSEVVSQAQTLSDVLTTLTEGVNIPVTIDFRGADILNTILALGGLPAFNADGTGATRANGGVPPGTTPRGNQTGGQGTRRPVVGR